MTPFLTILTPTYHRPQQLRRCMDSVARQTLVAEIDHIILPDYVGVGVGGMYQLMPERVGAVRGEYVFILCDDDVLTDDRSVETLRREVRRAQNPPLCLVQTVKGGSQWPQGPWWPPREGQIDLNCAVVRADFWKAHAIGYGSTYEGDCRFLERLHLAGIQQPQIVPFVFSEGAVSCGARETSA